MKKLLGLLVVLAVALPASADVLKNVQVKGEIQTIASDVHHQAVVADLYNRGTGFRALTGLSANLVEDVTANLMFQYANDWGNDLAWGRPVQGYWNDVTLVEGNVVLSNLFDCFELTVGRQFYGDEDSAVMYVGPNHYNAEYHGYTRALDAAKLAYADDVKALTLIAGQVNETNVIPAYMILGAAHTDMIDPTYGIFLPEDKVALYGGDFRINITEAVKAQAYLYDFRAKDADEAHVGWYGAKLTLNPEAFLLSGEYARDFAGHRLIKEPKDTGYMIKVDAAVKAADAMTLRGTFLYEKMFMAMGNYTPGLLVGHLGGGFNSAYAEGVRMFNVGIDYKPFEKWTFALDGYSFQERTGHHSATLEGDLTAKYQHNDYVQLFAGLGYAKYGGDDDAMINKTIFGVDNFKGQIGMLINF